MSETTKKLRIHGRVQGVWYRAWSRETALGLGLRGWVRNRGDGTVEMLVSGETQAVERLIARCREGPPAARVERIDVEDSDEAAPEGFEGRPSA
jgi:acylphosphatase